MSLAARHLEENGIADDRHGVRQGHRRILRRAALSVQRFSAGQCGGPAKGPGNRRPSHWSSHCGVLEAAPAPRTTVQSPLRWSADPSWKLDYSNIERLSPEEIRSADRSSTGKRRWPRSVRDEPA